MTGAAIEARDLCKTFLIPHDQRMFFKEYFVHPFRRMRYERNEALRGVSFEIQSGE